MDDTHVHLPLYTGIQQQTFFITSPISVLITTLINSTRLTMHNILIILATPDSQNCAQYTAQYVTPPPCVPKYSVHLGQFQSVVTVDMQYHPRARKIT